MNLKCSKCLFHEYDETTWNLVSDATSGLGTIIKGQVFWNGYYIYNNSLCRYVNLLNIISEPYHQGMVKKNLFFTTVWKFEFLFSYHSPANGLSLLRSSIWPSSRSSFLCKVSFSSIKTVICRSRRSILFSPWFTVPCSTQAWPTVVGTRTLNTHSWMLEGTVDWQPMKKGKTLRYRINWDVWENILV